MSTGGVGYDIPAGLSQGRVDKSEVKIFGKRYWCGRVWVLCVVLWSTSEHCWVLCVLPGVCFMCCVLYVCQVYCV